MNTTELRTASRMVRQLPPTSMTLSHVQLDVPTAASLALLLEAAADEIERLQQSTEVATSDS